MKVYSEEQINQLLEDFADQQKRFGVEADTDIVVETFKVLPDEYKSSYYDVLSSAVKQTTAPKFIKHSLGAGFEMSRLKLLLEYGIEQFSPEAAEVANPDKETFLAYAEEGNIPKTKVIKIQNDIPIVKDGKPFIYETKFLPSRPYGTISVSSKGKVRASYHDQLLKYQSAIEKGLVSGASVEVQGRISKDFLKWMYGSAINDKSPVADIQVIYNLPLPSGAEYRTTIKRAKNIANQISIQNDYPKFSEEDRKIIKGLEWALRHPNKEHIIDILSEVNIDNPSEGLKEFLDNPSDIDDLEIWREYIEKHSEGLWQSAANVSPPIYNEVNNDTSSAEEFENRYDAKSALREKLEQWQLYLNSNPEIAKIKKSYILCKPGTSEYDEKMEEVTNELVDRVMSIREYEEARRKDGNNARREELGWKGPEEGYALDIDHIMMDVVMEANKKGKQKGRSYDNPQDRFLSVEQVVEKLSNDEFDRQKFDVKVYNPSAEGKNAIKTYDLDSEEKVGKIHLRVQERNLKTLKEKFNLHSKKIDSIEHKIELIEKQKKDQGKKISEAAKNIKDDPETFQNLKEEMDDLNSRVSGLKGKLIGQFKNSISRDDWEATVSRVDVKEQNIAKFIYVVDSEGKFLFEEERFDAEKSGRAAHSELAAGKNIYGAGEIAFEKNEGSWKLTEINNGSGHYRTHPSSLEYVKAALSEELKTNSNFPDADVKEFMSSARLVDSLARGTPVRDADITASNEMVNVKSDNAFGKGFKPIIHG